MRKLPKPYHLLHDYGRSEKIIKSERAVTKLKINECIVIMSALGLQQYFFTVQYLIYSLLDESSNANK